MTASRGLWPDVRSQTRWKAAGLSRLRQHGCPARAPWAEFRVSGGWPDGPAKTGPCRCRLCRLTWHVSWASLNRVLADSTESVSGPWPSALTPAAWWWHPSEVLSVPKLPVLPSPHRNKNLWSGAWLFCF